MADKTLKMVFKNAAGGRVTLSVDNPKDPLTELEVTQAMNAIIAQNSLTSTGGDLVDALEAVVVTQTSILSA